MSTKLKCINFFHTYLHHTPYDAYHPYYWAFKCSHWDQAHYMIIMSIKSFIQTQSAETELCSFVCGVSQSKHHKVRIGAPRRKAAHRDACGCVDSYRFGLSVADNNSMHRPQLVVVAYYIAIFVDVLLYMWQLNTQIKYIPNSEAPAWIRWMVTKVATLKNDRVSQDKTIVDLSSTWLEWELSPRGQNFKKNVSL